MKEIIGQRIIIIGTTGSGKTTLAAAISKKLVIPHIELDGLYWQEDWVATNDADFEGKVKVALNEAGEAWVIDGNYSRTRHSLWLKAETVIWLDYPLWLIYWRLTWRTLRRVILREKLWNNNREEFWGQFFSKESIFIWAKQTYQRRKATYNQIIANNDYPHLQFIRFKHPSATQEFLKHLGS